MKNFNKNNDFFAKIFSNFAFNQLIHNRVIAVTVFFILACTNFSIAQLSGEIHYYPDIHKKEINFGPCYVGDELFERFVVNNTGDGTLRMLAVSPSVEIYSSPDAITPFEYLRFSPVSPALPFNLNLDTRRSDTIVFKYSASTDMLAEPIGRKTALLKLGLVNPQDTTQIVAQDTFKLIARKTDRFVEGFQEYLVFDSVFINSPVEITKSFEVRNTQKVALELTSTSDSLITQAAHSREFFFENKTLPIMILPKKSIVAWNIKYKPLDVGIDTAIFKVHFIPKPDIKPDSTHFCFVKVIGTGVRQKLDIVESNANFSNDTIYLGDVPIAEGKHLNITLQNKGNIPYGVLNQYFKEELTGATPSGFSFVRRFLSNKGHLLEGATDIVSMIIKPTSRGDFAVKYVIENDIMNRKFSGYQSDDTKKVIYLIGRAVEPEIKLTSSEIDFGNVIYSGDLYGDCPSHKDTLVQIFNVGNLPLNIKDILLDDDSRFSVSDREASIDGNSEKLIKFTYHSSYPAGNYSTIAKIISNSTSPKDTLRITLRAASVPPILANLSIGKNFKAKPGTSFYVPILLTNESYKPAIYSKYYELDINYNPTILKFEGRETIGTASEGSLSEISEQVRGSLAIKTFGNDFLLPSDTLILLRFKAFLGDNIATEIAMSNPIFGSGNCKRAVDTRIENGKFTLDSVCGLSLKAQPIDYSKVFISSFGPNPTNDNVHLSINFPSDDFQAIMEIYNLYGIALKRQKIRGQKGINHFQFDLSDLIQGAYFISIVSESSKITQPIIIEK